MLSSALMSKSREDQASQPKGFHSQLSTPFMPPSFKLDEGYSEETRSQSESEAATPESVKSGDMAMLAPGLTLPGWMTTLGEVERSELAYMILRTLRTSSVAAIVERLHPLLHLDPVVFLPPELTFQIFSYLNTRSLLVASATSRAWRARALDPRLWRRLYTDEGWAAEFREVRRFEAERPSLPTSTSDPDRKARMARTAADGSGEEQQRSKKRIPKDGFHHDRDGQGSSRAARASISHGALGGLGWREQHDRVEADETPMGPLSRWPPTEIHDEEMKDVQAPDAGLVSQSDSAIPRLSEGQGTSSINGEHGAAAATSNQEHLPRRKTISNPTSQVAALVSPWSSRLALASPNGERKLDWQHLYRRRRRLEENWHAGRYSTFQLPHPHHPEEAHRECVYTIQHSGRFLVSGSRDKTIRVWDLETQRLIKGPLFGHSGSVLCLQFDASEDEDIIISGSSDTDVIIWRFSTGEQLKKIHRAHAESVLNLKFDKRYLVTCSKDKSINVWSRRQLEATDDDFPAAVATSGAKGATMPQHVLNLANNLALIKEGHLASSVRLPTVPAYSLLISLSGHNAAVNAIQVFGDQIVSASGDRTIKMWSLRTGMCDMTIQGHDKGIACVQYDGKRIVSGSSDNTVKIFDRSGAEVACLLGHQYLVRTVQAGFGDVPGGEDDDRADARAVDRDFITACANGQVSLEQTPRSNRTPNAGSRNPEQLTSVGAALPPGGGGSRWGRIVSGSYDETIIIWKRDAEGKWVVGHRLQQEEAARAAAARLPPRQPVSTATNAFSPHAAPPTAGPSQHAGFVPLAAAFQLNHNAAMAQLPAVGGPYSQLNAQYYIAQQQAQQQQHGLNPTSANSPLLQWAMEYVQHNPYAPPSAAPQPIPPPPSLMSNQQNILQAPAMPTTNAPGNNTHPFPNLPQQAQPHPNQPIPHPGNPMTNAATAPIPTPNNHQQYHHPHTHPAPAHHPAGGNPASSNGNARVFKLQFDARRIICCSQDPKIVGWDFANGDEEIIEASRFFQGL